MRTTTSYSFYCRRSKMDRKGLAPIELGITINGSRKFINLPFKCSPQEFNAKRRPQYIQDYLDTQRVTLATIVTQMSAESIPLTASTLREYIRTGGVKSYTIKDLFDDYFKLLSKKVDVSITFKVYEKYNIVRRLFSDFISFDKECTAITPAVIEEFYIDLKGKYQDSTSCGMMTKLKTIIRYGIDNGKIKINPFQNTKITRGSKPIEMLSDEDFERIRTKEIKIPRLEKIRDMFIFGCGSGLAYIDMKNITPQDFQTIDGQTCIVKERYKTHNTFVSVLLPCAIEVAKKYDFNISSIVPSNQKANSYCTEIQDICGVTSVKSLHTHLGRHYYCNHLLNAGVRPEVVAKASGHSNYKTLMKYYARVEDKTTVNEIAKVL